MRRRRRLQRFGLGLGAVCLLGPVPVQAAPPGSNKPVVLEEVVDEVVDLERVVAAAERVAASVPVDPTTELAKRLVDGQIKLTDYDYEGAAIVFLDVLENYPQTQAATQAVFFLGEALARLGMERWAGEMFANNLTSTSPEARRFHQRSVARLFDLAAPRREPGFAREPGLSATPEARARLAAMGLPTKAEPPRGSINPEDVARLARWAESFPSANRIPQLRYAYGRYLYLKGEFERAVPELDGVSPVDVPLTKGGPQNEWRVRAAYIAGAATLASGKQDEALDRFVRVTKAKPENPRDRQIVNLAWMAIARIHHDAGKLEDAIRAYRSISRDSPFFPEAMYETSWTLLAVGRYDRALSALQQLLEYDPNSAVAPEIKQLVAKIKIQQRDYESAEKELVALRAEYEGLQRQLTGRLHAGADASRYFAAVVGEDMEHFSLASVLPVQIVPVARSLPRTDQAAKLAREVGKLEAELFETRALLARMEQAVRARERARVFTDLGASAASLDSAGETLVKVQEDLVRRLGAKVRGASRDQLRREAKALKARMDSPDAGPAGSMSESVGDLQSLSQKLSELEGIVNSHRAQLLATEHNYNVTRAAKAGEGHQEFLNHAAEVRDAIAGDKRDAAELRVRIKRSGAGLMWDDPWRDTRRAAMTAYRQHLARMYAAYSQVNRDAESDKLWERSVSIAARVQKARDGLETTAGTRLGRAIAVLEEERENVNAYIVQLETKIDQTKALAAQVLSASFHDLVTELDNNVVRSEVGLLDVAWSRKEVEQSEVTRLETARDRDLTELDQAVEAAMEDLRQ